MWPTIIFSRVNPKIMVQEPVVSNSARIMCWIKANNQPAYFITLPKHEQWTNKQALTNQRHRALNIPWNESDAYGSLFDFFSTLGSPVALISSTLRKGILARLNLSLCVQKQLVNHENSKKATQNDLNQHPRSSRRL